MYTELINFVALKGIYSEVRRGLAEPCMREDVLVMAVMKDVLRLSAYCER